MDFAKAIDVVRAYVITLEQMDRIQDKNGVYYDDPEFQRLDTTVIRETALVEQIAARIDPRLAEDIRQTNTAMYAFKYKSRLLAATELLARLEGREREAEILGPAGPQLAASDMHPWVWEAAARLWDDGHRGAAVRQAASAVFDGHVPAKLGVPKGTKPRALAAAFKTDPPTAGAPRLRSPGFTEGDEDWTNAHEGAQYLGLACATLVRNLGTHSTEEPPEQEALEALAMLSRFAHLCDAATVVTA